MEINKTLKEIKRLESLYLEAVQNEEPNAVLTGLVMKITKLRQKINLSTTFDEGGVEEIDLHK